ncbi:hypothetical protein BGZ70_004630 [Mortierella alpina]|uniref:Uncharacterized protein n=1 Tax=Mortierella alpina TaxID=64518 RepID=A0A9P6IQN4_MORAP|nr:hypothetical protein BGZ70_004630 [Mortierella alpina]
MLQILSSPQDPTRVRNADTFTQNSKNATRSPNQGLAASKICLMCFHVSGQPSFLDQLVFQNVTNSLSAFQLACLESGDGTFVPPAVRKGSSASKGHRGRDAEAARRIKTIVTTVLTALVAIASSAFM